MTAKSWRWAKGKEYTTVVRAAMINWAGTGEEYTTVVRAAMIHWAGTWAVEKSQEKELDVVEMRVLGCTCGVTKMDRIRNGIFRGTKEVGEI